MEFGINVDSLRKSNELRETKIKKTNENDNYNIKMVEYTFFIQNEIEISKIINSFDATHDGTVGHRFLTVKKWELVNICENDQKIINNKKIALLKYKKHDESMDLFINSFFQNRLHKNNNHGISSIKNASYIFWDLIHNYENFLDDFSYLSNKNIFFIDFSSRKMLYNRDHGIFYRGLDKCFLRTNLSIDQNNNKTLHKFIKIMETIHTFENKHFDLFFSKKLIKSKNFYETFKDLDNIIDEYLYNLYFYHFSDKIKINAIKLKSQIKSEIEENVRFLNTTVENVNWESYLLNMLINVKKSGWELFSLNSLFIYISYHMIRIFTVNDVSCVLHRFFHFLFQDMDISCTKFNNNNDNNNNDNNRFDIIKCRNNYDKFCNSIEYIKDYNNLLVFNDLFHVTIEQQQELYNFLIQKFIYDDDEI
jgi:hypothetical protein